MVKIPIQKLILNKLFIGEFKLMGTGPFLEKLNLKRHFVSQKSNVHWYPFATREEGQQFTMAV
jgi:hypothetical protein